MNQVKTGAVLNYVIIFLNTLLGLCYTPYMIRMLGQNEYGLYSLVASIIAYLTVLDFGFSATVVRYTAIYKSKGDITGQYHLFGLFFILYSIIGIISIILGMGIYCNLDLLFDQTMTPNTIYQAKIMILLLIFNLAVTFPMSVFSSIITAYESFVFQKIMIISRIVLSTSVIILLLYVGYKAISMVVVQTVFNVLLLSSNCWYCLKKLKVKIRFKSFKWPFIRELLGFSIWVFLGDLMFKFYWNTGQFVLGATSGTVAISVFALGVTLMQMYITFSGGISGVLLPRITTMITNSTSPDELAKMFLKIGRLQFFVLSLILSGFIIFGRQFIYFWVGKGYETVYVICLILFFSTLIPLIQNTGIIILQAKNKMRFRSIMLFAVGLVSLLFQIILAKKYGALGCSIAIGFANLIGQGVILNYYYEKYHNLNILHFWEDIIKMSLIPIIITIIGTVVFSYINFTTLMHLSIGIIAYCIIYIPITFKFCLNEYEKNLFMKPMTAVIYKIRNILN